MLQPAYPLSIPIPILFSSVKRRSQDLQAFQGFCAETHHTAEEHSDFDVLQLLPSPKEQQPVFSLTQITTEPAAKLDKLLVCDLFSGSGSLVGCSTLLYCSHFSGTYAM